MDISIEQLSQDLARAQYAEKTRSDYRKAAEALNRRLAKPIAEITREELREYVQHLTEGNRSISVVHNQLCALLFLFRRTLGKPEMVSFIRLPRRHSKLPTVLSKDEVHALLNAIKSPRYQALAMVMYATGLRIAEALVLKVDDIDAARGVIHVSRGKGGKPRLVPFSASLYQWLRQYWRQQHPARPYLFADRTGALPKPRTVRRALSLAAKRALIRKRVTPHVLRHYVPFRTMSCGFAAV